MIQVDIHVIELLTVRQRLEGKDIVDIESMLRQLHPALSQNVCPINNIMHQDILGLPHMPHIIPGYNPVLRKSMAELHYILMENALPVIDKIGQEHVHRRLSLLQQLQPADNLDQRPLFHPVV